jgi:peptide/nickel transport system substrate-binding protein/oligopeptide transport system substrate-binding protein
LRKHFSYFVIVASVLGCSQGPTHENTLTIALETSPNKLDPALVVDVAEGQICSMIFQGLVRFSPSGDIVPDAASSWESQDGGRRYVFRLDPDNRFSNGRPLTASDVVWSFERVLAADSRSPRQWVLDRIRGAAEYTEGHTPKIAGLHTPDDTTVVIELGRPFRPFIQMLAMPAACVVPKEAVDEEGALAAGPVGSGRWMLAQWERGDFLFLEPNPHYPGDKPRLDGVRFRIMTETFTRIAEFESGSLDVFKIPLAELGRFLSDSSLEDRIQSRPELRVLYIGLNTTRGPLEDARVRRALNMAVDVDRLIEVLTEGRAIRASGAIPPSLGGFEDRKPYSYDPPGARQLLAEAGYANGFEMEIWQRESPEGSRLVEAIQGYLHEIGVGVRIVKREWSAFKEAVSQGRVDAFFLDWYADYPDAENFLFPLFHSSNAGGGGNRAFFKDSRVDELIERAQQVQDSEEGERLYATIDGIVYDAAPWIYLYFPTTFVVVSPQVQGYVPPVLYLCEYLSTAYKSWEGIR